MRIILERRGKNLIIRIPLKFAKKAGIRAGMPIQLEPFDAKILVNATKKTKLLLNERLAIFNKKVHGGEVYISN